MRLVNAVVAIIALAGANAYAHAQAAREAQTQKPPSAESETEGATEVIDKQPSVADDTQALNQAFAQAKPEGPRPDTAETENTEAAKRADLPGEQL